jgi:hypothetical protein
MLPKEPVEISPGCQPSQFLAFCLTNIAFSNVAGYKFRSLLILLLLPVTAFPGFARY